MSVHPFHQRRQSRRFLAVQPNGAGSIHSFKAQASARAKLRKQSEIARNHRCDLRVAAGGLMIRQHNDRLTIGGHLNAPLQNAVREDVRAMMRSYGAAGKLHPHTVGIARNRIHAAVERVNALLCERVLLRTRHHTDRHRHLRRGSAARYPQAGRAAPEAPEQRVIRHRLEGQPVATDKRAPIQSADMALQIRGAASQHHGHRDTAIHGKVCAHGVEYGTCK